MRSTLPARRSVRHSAQCATGSRLGAQFLIHANSKTSFEYQIQPQQIVYSPGTNIPLTNAFRMNSAVAGLEFVY